MSMTLKQKERAIERAIKRLNQAAESLDELCAISIEYGVDYTHEENFRRGIKERACYWEHCTWWRKS